MNEIRCGDRVRYRVGKQQSEGRVVNVALGMLTIETTAGRHLRRQTRACTLVTTDVNAATADPQAK